MPFSNLITKPWDKHIRIHGGKFEPEIKTVRSTISTLLTLPLSLKSTLVHVHRHVRQNSAICSWNQNFWGCSGNREPKGYILSFTWCTFPIGINLDLLGVLLNWMNGLQLSCLAFLEHLMFLSRSLRLRYNTLIFALKEDPNWADIGLQHWEEIYFKLNLSLILYWANYFALNK